MKKFALPGIIIFSLLASSANSQLSASKETENRVSEAEVPAIAATRVGSKALKNFQRNFADGSDVTWFTGTSTICASMEREGKKINVVYNLRGQWLRDVLTYPENLLDKDIRRAVRSSYFDHQITLVQEFREAGIIFYIIHMEDATSYLKLVYCDGYMGVHEEFNKQ
jgi:hypothetical protein